MESAPGGTSSDKPGSATRSLKEINEAHVRRIDKFLRMYSGAASTLIAFHSGYIYLEIRIDDRLRIPLEKITRNIAKSWRNEPELRGATGFSASIYKSLRRSGFVLEGSATTAEQAELIRRMKEPANQPDAFLKIIEEDYGPEASLEPRSNV